MSRRKIEIFVGDVFETKNNGKCTVVCNLNPIIITFNETGYTTSTSYGHLIKGLVKDKFKPVVVGIGYIGCGKHPSSEVNSCKVSKMYATWSGMLKRCYDDKSKYYSNYGGRGVTVCKFWHNYQNFGDWYINNYKDGCTLDKDLTIPSSTVYSPESCCFVPHKINTLLLTCKKTRGECVICVCYRKDTGKFLASCRSDAAIVTLGSFNTEYEAFLAYKTFKESHVKLVAEESYCKGEITQQIYNNLLMFTVNVNN